MKHGGCRCTENGDCFDGAFKFDKKHGFGTLKYFNGDKYVGFFEKDKRCGKGTFFYANGDRYDGEWKNDLYNGYGTFCYANGEKWVGFFNDGVPAKGEGVCKNKDGKYEKLTLK